MHGTTAATSAPSNEGPNKAFGMLDTRWERVAKTRPR